jgi:hypothetical protein
VRRALALLGALVLSGCLGADEEAKPLRGREAEVVVVMAGLQGAIEKRDFRGICDGLFTTAARRRAGGRRCARRLRSRARGLSGAKIELLRVEVKEGGAEARVRVRSEGQDPVEETVELARERGKFRIDGLRG